MGKLRDRINNSHIKTTHVILATATLALTIIVGSFVYGSAQGALSNRIEHLEKEVAKLTKFMGRGDRFTEADGKLLEGKINDLYREMNSLPPAWFQKSYDELKVTVRELSIAIEKLNISVAALEAQARGPQRKK